MHVHCLNLTTLLAIELCVGPVLWATSRLMASQFPHRGLQELGVHGHLFVNGGNLSLLSGTGRSIHQVVTEDFAKRWRWTVVSLQCLWFRHDTMCCMNYCKTPTLIRLAFPPTLPTLGDATTQAAL